MNDSTSKIALVQSRLPYTDRRALSEAWFSALHLASDAPPLQKAPERRGVAPGGAAPGRAPAQGRTCRVLQPPAAGLPQKHEAKSGARGVAAPCRQESARRRGAVARSKTVLRPPLPFCTSLTIGLGAGRVQLLLRRDGGTLHVVALCRPQVVETVRRALALADAHLRARGESVRSSVRPCDATEAGA